MANKNSVHVRSKRKLFKGVIKASLLSLMEKKKKLLLSNLISWFISVLASVTLIKLHRLMSSENPFPKSQSY